jgi:O-antigen/teichoic acid export membrane protein
VNKRLEALKRDLRNPLYRNGYALMANTAVTSLLGVIYWILADHLYAKAVVGRASAQVAAMMLISALTQLNFTSVLVRFLARAGSQTARLIGTSYGVAVTFSALAGTLVVLISHFATSSQSALHMSFGFGVWFVVSTSIWSIFNLQDGAMTGLRRTIWVPVENGSFNVAKIILLFAFKPTFGINGIFVSTSLPVILACIPVNYAMFFRFVPRHVRENGDKEQRIDRTEITKYIAGDYVSTLFGQAMTTFMPVLVAGVLGNTANAYFFNAQTMGMALDLIAFNLAQSLTVEVSADEERVRHLTLDASKRVAVLVLPLAVVLFIAAPLVLRLFGAQFSQHATWLLRLMVISSLPKAVIAIHIAMARVYRKTHRNGVTAAIQATLLIGGSVLLMKQIGIDGVGYAAIGSQVIVALLVLPWMVKMLQHQGRHYRDEQNENSSSPLTIVP